MGRAGGGGGRGFSGGGGRSFGGRSGGGGFSRGGSSGGFGFGGGSGRPSAGRSGGFGGPGRPGGFVPPPRPHFYPMGPRGYGPRRFRQPFFGGGGCGCLMLPIAAIILVVVVLIAVIAAPSFVYNESSGSTVTASSVEREPLPSGSVNETDYFTDELDWIRNTTTLTAGMKNFYQETGVQPYLFLTDNINGNHYPTDEEVEAFSNDLYDELFTDEAHLLLIFFEYNETYYTWYLTGTQAKTVLDQEAMDILLDYIDKYYFDSGLTDDEFFSKAFDEAGTRIMSVTTSPWIPVLIVLGILAILIVTFFWWRSYKKQKNLEAQQVEETLKTPLETFGDTEAAERAKKYDDPGSP